MGDFVDEKMARDPAYAPYCMRCPGIRRMDRLSPSIAQSDALEAFARHLESRNEPAGHVIRAEPKENERASPDAGKEDRMK